VNIGRLVFIDEAGSTISMTRTHGRASRGARVHDHVPRNRGTVTTMIGGLTVDGLVALMTVEGGTTGDVFVAFIEKVLLPELRRGDLVVMDNLGAHKDKRVRGLLASVGAYPVYLPPYSPDLNPIELTWAWVKDWLKSAKARTRDALDNCLAWAIDCITPEMARNWFQHCGYVDGQ